MHSSSGIKFITEKWRHWCSDSSISFPSCFALPQKAACECAAALWMSPFQVRNSEVIFIARLYLYIFPVPTSSLSPSSVNKWLLWRWRGERYCQCTMETAPETGLETLLAGRRTYSADDSVMVIISASSEEAAPACYRHWRLLAPVKGVGLILSYFTTF